ncbi:PstS family phosphate ABC transporter substrate-binding protein [Argonema antarcticum]|uniref:PstS family phosphate ABC transporter substrate-binding protein n=1 Tax=Argonema antarcticum TaxID=2942763 RepID=UPI002012046C|nr:PstS family phosphate ABC transporter substrate-binding protein [Argonema antarcticum]MCL1473341.1 PstS family phosphate ABC transporter substrate-binding protein [Argonema antarcticum A004/B2]
MVVNKLKFKLNRLTLVGVMAIVATTIGVSVSSVKSQSPALIKIDGSSTVYPISAAVAEEFQRARRNAIRVTVGISGTGGGFKKFCRGETDISNASRPILAEELQACRAAGVQFIELPVAYDALTVVVNPQNNWATNMTVPELKKMWEPTAQGSITKWNQVRQGWPDAPLKLFGAGADSGTFDYFTEAIVGKSKSSRGDYTASEDDNVLVQGVSRDRNALGYFGYAYYEANKARLKAVAINGVLPSRQAVENGSYKPLSRPIFIYVNAKSAQRNEVRDFVNFYISNAPRLVPVVRYVPLPAQVYRIATSHFQNRKLGTVFAGDAPVGLTIQQLLQREASQ